MKWYFESGQEVTFAGCPNNGGSFEPRYLIPALANCLGNDAASWAAASWCVLSAVPGKQLWEAPRQYWKRLFGHARHERLVHV